MAAVIQRTTDDDVTDALRAIADAEREIRNWRAHLQRIDGEPERSGIAEQARRSARIVAGCVATAAQHTADLARTVKAAPSRT